MSRLSEETVFHTVIVPIVINKYRVQCLLCSALEGGSKYWIENTEIQLGNGVELADLKENGKLTEANDYWPSNQIAPFIEGCGLKIKVVDENDLIDTLVLNDQGLTTKTIVPAILNIESMRKGLELMAQSKIYSHHWRHFLEENDDADTGDMFLQFCIFGEVLFG